jgi:hypothetical protein
MTERLRVLITVKTYPHPDPNDLERVCTAGLTETGSFVRLYPVPLRYLPIWQNYAKYQWIEVDAEKHSTDRRKESYRPNVDSIQLLGEPLSTARHWAARKDMVFRHPVRTMEELYDLQDNDGTSLGLVRPAKVEELLVVPDADKWKEEWEADLAQIRLLGPQRKPLKKIPFKFRYQFRCRDARCKGHVMSMGDWELGALYLNELDRLGSAEAAASSVKNKFFNQLCGRSVDTHFFVGTVAQFGTWIVLGTFYPPLQPVQKDLFNSGDH